MSEFTERLLADFIFYLGWMAEFPTLSVISAMGISDTRSPSPLLRRRQFIQSSAGAVLAGSSFKSQAGCGNGDVRKERVDTRARAVEPIIEPDLPTIVPHHHLWFTPDSSVTAMLDKRSQFGHGLGLE